MPEDDELAGEVAIVTGGGRGVGRAIARALAAAGAKVAVAARTQHEIEETASDINAAGGTAVAVPTDVTDLASVERLVAYTRDELGPADVLVSGAGVASGIGPLWQVPAERWWNDVEVTLRGAFNCAHTVLPGMLERGRGRIIHICTYLALRPVPYASGYAAAKAGLLRLTDSLDASTSAHGVRVFAMSPGLVRTNLSEGLVNSEWMPEYADQAPERWVGPERAGELAVYLASGRGDALSGRFLHISDDVAGAVARAEQVVEDDLFTLRLRTP